MNKAQDIILHNENEKDKDKKYKRVYKDNKIDMILSDKDKLPPNYSRAEKREIAKLLITLAEICLACDE